MIRLRLSHLIPTLRIHSWGGFGSQIFTAQLILRLQENYPNRRIKVVVHTSGVTRRQSELNFEALGVKMLQIEDFQDLRYFGFNNTVTSLYGDITQKLRSFFSLTLIRLCIIQNANSEESFNQIKFWTLALRGHYTGLILKKPTIQLLFRKLFDGEDASSIDRNRFVVHYRLGDLLNLGNKKPIDSARLEIILKNLSPSENLPLLLSDSDPEEVRRYLENSPVLMNSPIANYDPLTTLATCIYAETFVGTGAKISLWAAIFRSTLFGRESYLPIELRWVNNNSTYISWY
jgi:hypothetical protein